MHLLTTFVGLSMLTATAADWPQFRGPQASGVSASAPPVTWDAASGARIRWKTPIPGLGHASPITWSNRIYVATTIKPGAPAALKIGLYGDGDSYQEKEVHSWHLLCLDQASGSVLWDRTLHEAVPRLERHTKASHFNSTPATDGRHLVAILGSEGLFGFDMTGRKLWHRDLGRMDAGPYNAPTLQWGFASSPVLHDGRVVVQCDVLSEQFVAVFDAATGRELWRTPRHDVATWSTPIVSVRPSRTQIVVNGWKQIGAYDFSSGAELWRLREGGDIPVASPVLAEDLVILTSGHGNLRPMRAVRLDAANGDITPSEIGATNAAVAWCHPRKGNYLQTPIVVGTSVWGCSNDGVVTCFDLRSGALRYEERIGGGRQGFTASPVSAGGHLYFTGELGDVFVLPCADTFRVLATNQVGGLCLATPAIAGDALLFRTTDQLVAVGDRR